MNNITVAILDDDILARNTIKELLEDSRYEVVKEFQEAITFLKWIKNNEINILLCDMKMPKINGLELIERLRVTHKYLPVIAISNFDDFEFARGCLVYGVEDYLLKSGLDKKKLIKVLDRVSIKNQIISKKQQNKTNCFNADEVITVDSLQQRANVPFIISSVTPMVFTLNYPILEMFDYKTYRKANFNTLVDIINQVLSNNYPYVLQIEKDNLVTVYLSYNKGNDIPSLVDRINNSFVEKIRRKVKRLLDLSVFVVQGNTDNFRNTYEKREHLLNKMSERLYLVDSEDLYYDESNQKIIEGYVFKEHCLSILNFSIETSYEELFTKVLNYIFSEMIESKISKNKLSMVAKKLLDNLKVNSIPLIDQIDNVQMFKFFIKEKYLLQLREKNEILKEKYSPIIFQLLQYIQQNYHEDYSLADYASKMNVSYTHLSRMFKKEVGLGFAEYTNKIKVNQAKLLLVEGDKSIKHISELAGFQGYNYFFRVFKDIEGVPPIEYIAKNCSN